MPWAVLLDDAFAPEFDALDRGVQRAIAAYVALLEEEGPALGRPFADTLNGSKHRNMKELRPTVSKVEWRVAFAFDPKRQAILLVAAAKGGVRETRFYGQLIRTADRRFDAHLERLDKENGA